MQTVILFPATPQQLDALHAWHLHEAAHASTVPACTVTGRLAMEWMPA